MTQISLKEKQALILHNEQNFAEQVARKVVDKPVLALWMILIPIFFVFYFLKFKQYTNGLKAFATNFLLARKRALQEAFDSINVNKPANIEKLVEMAHDVPSEIRPEYRTWMSFQVDHYRQLLSVSGDSYGSLIRSFYNDKSSYLIFCNRLNRVEKEFNAALFPFLQGDMEAIKDIIAKMEQSSEELRRNEAECIFGSSYRQPG